MIWNHFVIPSLLLVLQPHVSSNAFKIRLNEYFYQRFDEEEVHQSVREKRVFGVLAALIDAASEPDAEMEGRYVSDLLYDIFPGLEEFLSRVTPTENPFCNSTIDLNPLAHFMAHIQVFLFIWVDIFLSGCQFCIFFFKN